MNAEEMKWGWGTGLGFLRPVSAARLFAAIDAEGVAASTDDLITNSREIANTTAADEDDRVFLEVVTFARNVDGDFLAVAQTHAGDFPQSRVGFLGGHRSNDQADPLLLGAAFENGTLGAFALHDAVASDQLIDGWHTFAMKNFRKEWKYQRWESNPHVLADTGF